MTSAATPQAAVRGKTRRTASASIDESRGRRLRLTGRALVLGTVIMLILLASVVPLRNLLSQRAQMASLQRQEAQLQRQNDRLQAQVDQLNDPAYLQRLARECLGMVMPGEIAFRTIPKHGTPTPPAC